MLNSWGTIALLLAAAIGLGFVSLRFLQNRGWFHVRSAETHRGVRFAAAVATMFGVWQVFVDSFVTRFPKELNVPLPQSLLFYPAIAYVVEVIFHASPLAILLFARDRLPERWRPGTAATIWVCCAMVAAIEPIVQMRMGGSTYVGVFVFGFTLVELAIFRRYDFVSMYAFRLVFYLWWHVIWGSLRLWLLF